jgi:hypothetical protein
MGNRNFIPLDKICARSNPENRKVTIPRLAKLRECYIQNLKLQIEKQMICHNDEHVQDLHINLGTEIGSRLRVSDFDFRLL